MTTPAELRVLVEKASPGPWRVQGDNPPYDTSLIDGHRTVLLDGPRFKHPADAAFIAAARDAVPKLLDVVEAAQRWRDTSNKYNWEQLLGDFWAAVDALDVLSQPEEARQ